MSTALETVCKFRIHNWDAILQLSATRSGSKREPSRIEPAIQLRD